MFIDLDSKFKAFIPEFIPSVGEVDAVLKPARPDNTVETLGLANMVFYKNSLADFELKTYLG